MALGNGSRNDIVRRRREAVGRLRVYGMTEREIAIALPKQGIVNPQTGEPFSHQTVHLDCEALRQEWRENAAVSTAEHQARELAEVQEIKRQAFLDRDGMLALRAIEKEMKILGTAAPEKVEIKVNIEVVTRLWNAIEQRGDNPEVVLNDFYNHLVQ